MIMELAVLELLQKCANESNGKARLSKRKIQELLIEDYNNQHNNLEEAEKIFTASKVRTAIDRLILHDDKLNDEEEPDLDDQMYLVDQETFDEQLDTEDQREINGKLISYTITEHDGGRSYRTGFHVNRSFTDMELKFLIDSIMYSKTIDTESAEDLSNRLKGLSNKKLAAITPYTSGVVFGQRGPASNVDVLKNMNTILDAIISDCYLEFTENVFDVVDNKIVLTPLKKNCVIPLQVFLNNGQYYMLAKYELKKKEYQFLLDLMTDLNITKTKVGNFSSEVNSVVTYRSDYIRQHPFVMGGKPEWFTLRVKRTALTIVVNAFGTDIKIIPGSVTDTTVDVKVNAAPGGMKFWLLINYKDVSLVNANPEFIKEMEAAVGMLEEKYLK